MKISGIYKITNTVTGDLYIGSSKNVRRRWTAHKSPSRWKQYKNNPMYLDMQKYGTNKFVFEILEVVEPEELKDAEQKFIETLKPTYNNINANGLNVERRKEYQKEYKKTDKYKNYQKEYQQSNKYKKHQKEYDKEYKNQLCIYNNEILTLNALSKRFSKAGIPHPQIEAKKYLLNKSKDK